MNHHQFKSGRLGSWLREKVVGGVDARSAASLRSLWDLACLGLALRSMVNKIGEGGWQSGNEERLGGVDANQCLPYLG